MKILTKYQYNRKFNANPTFRHHCKLLSSTASQEDYVLIKQKTSTLHFLLQLCARTRDTQKGKACHAQVFHLGLSQDTLISNILINFYSNCGLVDVSRKVFDQMPQQSLVSWNTMIGSYTQSGKRKNALILFVEMRKNGYPYSEFTVSSVVCACAGKCNVIECRQLHCFAVKVAMDGNVFIGTALLDVYAKSGFIQEASRVFYGMPERSDVTWSSMVAGFVQSELYIDGLVVFKRSQVMGLEFNQFMLSSVICACAGLGALIAGKLVHAVVWKTGFGSNNFVASSLVDMYAKCGALKEAYAVFLDVDGKSIVLWNVMVSGFGKHSCSWEAMILFEKMQQAGLRPDEVTYVSVLSACSHMGLVSKGQAYFGLMTREHNIYPNVVHYSCMVDVLCRSGLVHEAYDLIQTMPFAATASMWGSLLASCRNHRSLELAEIAAKNLFEIEPNNAGNYVLLANTYAANKMWNEVAVSRKFLKENEVMKERGESWIEVKDKVHTFVAGEKSHTRVAEIYSKLDDLMEEMKKLGYKVESDYDLHDVGESRKQESLRHHSEKLALIFGLMCLPSCTPIRIMKNLRICGDCHSFMKFASSITGRQIIVRDVNRFHHFSNGVCSCREFW